MLVGGVLSGQSLIRAAELRSTSTDYSKYIAATQTFRDKYFAIPGDMNNATSFWNAAHATPATCGVTTTSDARTCNGNGDGLIDLYAAGSRDSNEYFRFWQQLANANLIEGQYSGIEGPGGVSHGLGGTNVPRGKLANSVWYARDMGNRSGHTELFDGAYGNTLFVGGQDPTGQPRVALLKPEDAWNLDTKMDDGKPATGSIIPSIRVNCTSKVDGSAITTGAGDAGLTDAIYNLTNTSAQCILLFRRFTG